MVSGTCSDFIPNRPGTFLEAIRYIRIAHDLPKISPSNFGRVCLFSFVGLGVRTDVLYQYIYTIYICVYI